MGRPVVKRLGRSFFRRDVLEVARDLLGAYLLNDGVGGPIVETEAYHEEEAASHSHRGRTRRNASMFLRGGHLYVYRIHRSVCANAVCGPSGEGAAVLVRALLPTCGRDAIAGRRGARPEREWTDGPGKVCAALGVSLDDDGTDLVVGSGLRIEDRGLRYPDELVERGPRVGISRAVELPWRFRVAAAVRRSRP